VVRSPAAPALVGVVVAGVVAVVSTALVAVLAGVCSVSAARAAIGRRVEDREERRLRGLLEALGALTAELRSGRTVDAASADAARSCPDERAADALVRALRAPDLPLPPVTEGAFADALDRIAAAVRLSGRTGCSLAAVLAAVEDDVRARLRHARELRTAVAGPRASAALLAGLPLLGLAMGGGIGADPWRVLTTTGTGQMLLVLGVALEVVGVAWTARLVRSAVA
jgi:tight adherence protein B